MNKHVIGPRSIVWMTRLYWMWLSSWPISYYYKYFSICSPSGHVLYLSAIAACLTMFGITFLRKAWVWWVLVIGGILGPAASCLYVDWVMNLRGDTFLFTVLVWILRLKWGLLISGFMVFTRDTRKYFASEK